MAERLFGRKPIEYFQDSLSYGPGLIIALLLIVELP
jgi:hypothetical protein